MKTVSRLLAAMLIAALFAPFGAGPALAEPPVRLATLPLASPASLGTSVSLPQKGLVKIQTKGNAVICLGVIEKPKAGPGMLIFQAQLKSAGLKGAAFLEMWCQFPGGGKYFSRGYKMAVRGDSGWKRVSTPFYLKPGQVPSRVILNVNVAGAGTVWVKAPVLLLRKL